MAFHHARNSLETVSGSGVWRYQVERLKFSLDGFQRTNEVGKDFQYLSFFTAFSTNGNI